MRTAHRAVGDIRQAIERSRAMKGLDRSAGLAMAILALGLAGPVGAQESLDAGKTGAQLFASDCALCHKSPQGLAKSGGLFGLSGFLKQHYTASQETANVVAKYLESFGNAPSAPAKRAGPTKRTAKGDEKAKPDEKKPDVDKTNQTWPNRDRASQPSPSQPSPSRLSQNRARRNQPNLSPLRRSRLRPKASPSRRPSLKRSLRTSPISRRNPINRRRAGR